MTLLDLTAASDAATPSASSDDRVAWCVDLHGRNAVVVADELGAGHPFVIVLGPALAVDDALAVATRIDELHPEITTILVAHTSPELFERALHAGVRRVVDPSAGPQELANAIDAAVERVARRQSNAGADVPDVLAGPARRVITVLSPKGGSGKTTVASNLAAGLAGVHPGKVAIVDLDLQFGDIADAFLLDPAHSLLDVPDTGPVDGARVKLALTPAGHGLHALCAPDDPAAGEEVPVHVVAGAIDALAADLPFVIVDTGAGIDAPALAAIERSTDIVLVGSLDVPSIRSLRKLIRALDRLGMTDARRHVVLNRADSEVGIRVAEVEATLDLPIAVHVPSSRAVPTSINVGRPVILADPTSPVATALQQLVGRFTDVPQASPARRRVFRRNAS